MNPKLNTSAIDFAARRLGAWYAAIAFVVIGLFSSVLLAQTPDSAKPPASSKNEAELHQQSRDDLPPGPTTGHVQYVGPDTYILLDSSGKPQPMPGMSYEDFMAAWRKLNQRKTSDNQPNYSIESIVFNGQVVGQNAELQCDATVQLLADGPIEVPLGLVGAILQGTPRFGAIPHADDSKSSADTMPKAKTELGRLTYDPEHGGFQATFSGHSGEKRRLSLQLIVPLLHDGAETSLPINCPRAVSSQLTVNIGAKISEARTNAGTLVSQDATPNGGTTLKVAGPAGLFRLSWQSVSKDSPAFTSVLNALGTIQVTIDGRGVRSDARLTVRSYGGTFDQFRVRLPIGAQLVRPDSSGVQDAKYHIRVEPDSTSSPKGNTDTRRQVVVVELLQKQQGPVVVDLATEQSGEPASRDQAINLGGFEVIGAVRQFGDIALSVANDWQARWEIGPFVRQVDPSELDPTLQTSNPTAAFQYDRQPWSLNVRVAPRQLRVQVTPKYDLECLPDEARLTVHLGYQVFGRLRSSSAWT